MEFPEFRTIPSNSVTTQFPEFRTGITSRPHPHAYWCHRRLVCGISKQFRYGIPGIESIGNYTELHGIPGNSKEFRSIPELEAIPGIPGIGWNSVWIKFWEFRELTELGQ